jgi:hypothetical protein
MDYDTFRTLWQEALARAELMAAPFWPTETIDVRRMDRTYRVSLSLHQVEQARPFYVTAGLSWRWDALLSARAATTEEDLLVELLGDDGYDQDTDRPWVRVDVTLHATLPADAPLPMPDADAWRRWIGTVMHEMESLLPPDLREEHTEGGEVPLFWQGNPRARLKCHPDGQLALSSVDLPSWRGIELPRQWDDPERVWNEPAGTDLEGFCGWVRDSLRVWAASLRHLGLT